MGNCKTYYLGQENFQGYLEEEKEYNFYLIDKKEVLKKNINHHILLLDVSLSMEEELEELKKRVKLTLNALKSEKNNYVSVITYSGHDESEQIINGVKCDRISYEMGEVFEKIEKKLEAKSSTVISEPLKLAIESVEKLKKICNKNHIVLFTDGYLSSSKWSIEEEQEKILKLADICREKNIFFNTIGFGSYYDREFLKDIVNKVGAGTFTHIIKIQDYYKNITALCKEINDKKVFDIEIGNEEYFVLNNYKSYKKGVLRIPSEEGVIIAVPNEKLKIKGRIFKKNKFNLNIKKVFEDFLYSSALYYLNQGDIEKTEYTIAQSGDINLYENINNSYSFVEIGQAMSKLKEAFLSRDKRFKKGKVTINIDKIKEEKICLLEVLKEIIDDEESKLLWDYSYNYKRISRKNIMLEKRYKFQRPKIGFGEVVDLSIGSKKLNVGVKVKVEGEIIDENTMLKLDGHIYREYNIILNGNINTEYIWCELSKKLKSKFRKEKIIKSSMKYGDKEILCIDLKKLKITNKKILNSLNLEEISKYLYKIEVLKCKVWAINKTLNELKIESNKIKNGMTLKEKIRNNYGIDNSGLYRITSKIKEEEKIEVYEAKALEWSIEKFPKKKENEKALKYYSIYRTLEINETIKRLQGELSSIKKEKKELSYKINLVRISCGLMNKTVFIWDEAKEKKKSEMDKLLKRNLIIEEKVNILTKELGDIVVRQDSYKILTKYNE